MKDYREYIESWVHEIKLPITALELMVQKEEPKKKNRLMEELERIDNYVEQVLFYARSEQVYQDFVISETDITEVIYEVMAKKQRTSYWKPGCSAGRNRRKSAFVRWKVDELFSAAGYYKRREIYGFSKGDFPDPYLYKGRCRQKRAGSRG